MAKLKTISAKDFKDVNKRGKINLLDVSKLEKFESASIPNSRHVEYKVLKNNYESFASKELPNYLSSDNGRLGKKAAKFLSKKGYDAYYIEGGTAAYGHLYSLNRIIKQG